MIHFVDAGPLVAAFRRPQDRDPVHPRKRGMILPLPFGRGEGRGEGSRRVVYPRVPSVDCPQAPQAWLRQPATIRLPQPQLATCNLQPATVLLALALLTQ